MQAISKEPAANAVAWFVALQDARRRSDPETARLALSELRRLGVRVEFDGPDRREDRPDV